VDRYKQKAIWLTWEAEGSIRSKVLSTSMGVPLCTLDFLENQPRLRLIRYCVVTIQTLAILIKFRPAVTIVQNPSIFLAFVASMVKRMLKYNLVIDLHTHCITPEGVTGRIYRFFNNVGLNKADLIIVTNDSYKKKIMMLTRSDITVLPDKIPEIECKDLSGDLKGSENVLFICTYSQDEPWRDVIQAAESLPKTVHIYISGRVPNGLNIKTPINVTITGYLVREEYERILEAIDAVIVLTKKENCLPCGAYEALAAEKPLVLSDKKVIKEFFSKGSIYTENKEEAIAVAVKEALKNQKLLKQKIIQLKKEKERLWGTQWEDLKNKIFSLY
jgi:glycosyltransferase involved in cell wall biosynthesis